MQIQLDTPELHAIQAYTDKTLRINDVDYAGSVILSREEIIPDLKVKNIEAMDEAFIALLTRNKPKIIILGHQNPRQFLPLEITAALASQKIGIECMSLGAACRTFNLLLGEGREVTGGFIF